MSMTNWEQIKRMGPSREYLFSDRLDDATEEWLQAFAKEAEENGCSIKRAPGVNRIYVVVGTDWRRTGICPKCHNQTVMVSRCVQCGWEN